MLNQLVFYSYTQCIFSGSNPWKRFEFIFYSYFFVSPKEVGSSFHFQTHSPFSLDFPTQFQSFHFRQSRTAATALYFACTWNLLCTFISILWVSRTGFVGSWSLPSLLFAFAPFGHRLSCKWPVGAGTFDVAKRVRHVKSSYLFTKWRQTCPFPIQSTFLSHIAKPALLLLRLVIVFLSALADTSSPVCDLQKRFRLSSDA